MEGAIDQYRVKADEVEVNVKIIKKADCSLFYELTLPQCSPATEAFLEEIKHQLVVEVQVTSAEILDPKIIQALKDKFKKKSELIINSQMPKMDPKLRASLIGRLLHEMVGLGNVEYLLSDPNLEEVVINSAEEPLRVYHKKHGWLVTNVSMPSEETIQNYSNTIARRIGRQITMLNPLLDAHLVTGDRANAVLYPISTKGHTITIRKFARDPWTVVDFINNKTCSIDIFSILWLAIQYEMNVLISGGTASGKTSLMNVCMPFIPPNHRIISIEDSVLGSSQILYKKEGKFILGKISDLVDSEIDRWGCRLNDACEIANNISDTYIFSMNKYGKIELAKPSSFIRHKVNKDIYEVILASGRKVSVTQDHSLFILSNNQITPIKTSELTVGDFIATPRKLVYEGSEIIFDLTEYLEHFKELLITGEPLKKVIKDNLVTLGKSAGRYLTNLYLPVEKLIGLNIKLSNIDKEKLFILPKRAPKHGRVRIPLLIKIDNDLACSLGLWLADGCYDKTSTIFSGVAEECNNIINKLASKFETRTRLHSDGVSLMINSKTLKILFERVFELKGNAYTKKIPAWVYNLGLNETNSFLKGYFSGDGTVKKHEVSCCSSSRDLLSGLQTLLLRYEILLRISQKMRKDKCYEAYIFGVKFLRTFKEKIGFLQNYQNIKLEKATSFGVHEHVDIIPLEINSYLKIKHAAGQAFKDLYTYKSWKSWQGAYVQGSNIGRTSLQTVMEFVKTEDNDIMPIKNLAFSDLIWDYIVDIRKTNFHGYVYDLSVPGNESFVCNNIVAHNTREIQLPKFLYWCPLTTRQPNPEGKGEINMLDLLVNALRMRPDRIILGEIRRGRDAEILFEAMHTGHSVYATVHADSINATIERLVNPPISVPPSQLSAVNLNVTMFRDRRRGIRRVYQLGEFIPTQEEAKTVIKPNILYRWKPESDAIVQHSESLRFFEELNMHTGLSQKEISQDLLTKQKILKWMIKNDLRSLEKVGEVFCDYYLDQQNLLKKVNKGKG